MMRQGRWFIVVGVVTVAFCFGLAALTPSAQAGKGGKGKPTGQRFDVDVTGDIVLFATSPTGLPADIDETVLPAIGRWSGKGGATNVVVNRPNPCLTLGFLVDHFNSVADGLGDTCFGADQIVHYGTLNVWSEEIDGTIVAGARYWFRAMGTDGETEIQYYLEMQGTLDNDSWVPAAMGDTLNARFTSWQLLCSGGGRAKKIACTGEGNFSETGVTVTFTRTK